MLDMTKVEFELIPDADMYFFFRKGMGGIVSCISKRYSKADNKFLKSIDLKQESKHFICQKRLIYMVNLSLAYLQQADLNGQTLKCLARIDIAVVFLNILQVDLEYPKKLQEVNNYYPLVPDKIKIKNVAQLSIKDC